jgi:hypothetical protein
MYYNPASLDRAHRALLTEAKPAAMEKNSLFVNFVSLCDVIYQFKVHATDLIPSVVAFAQRVLTSSAIDDHARGGGRQPVAPFAGENRRAIVKLLEQSDAP